ncbi:MAG: molybdopterin converting factor subunit 1 [Alphaproteobacteria bacterium]|nr:molybdopterin converting factor subunit 1 [Alphaproteobacteria bacterium]|tara:strand:- start:328 stop:579 length:252 start_codon:yes stop_codon:yes gene_type:complete
MKILYFAWIRQRIGLAVEELERPPDVTTVNELINWLIGQGEGYTQAFEKRDVIRVAVNQDYVSFDHPIADDDEIAFFPPVTGG